MSAMSPRPGPKGQLARLALGLAALALTTPALTKPAHAQDPVAIDRVASDGIDRPIHDYSGEGDASSLELNPALLSAIKGLDAVIMGYRSTSAFTRGTGFGGFLGLNLGLGFATGLGIQRVNPGFGAGYVDARAAQNPDFTKVSWGISGGDGKVAALGLGVHWLLDRGQSLRRPDLDLGLLLRIRNYASVGAVARLGPADLLAQDALQQEFTLTGELALRPLGTRMLELAGGVRTRWRGNPSYPTPQVGEYLGVLPRGRVAFRQPRSVHRQHVALGARLEAEGVRHARRNHQRDNAFLRLRAHGFAGRIMDTTAPHPHSDRTSTPERYPPVRSGRHGS